MRTLVVAFEYPWPTVSGSRIRLLTIIRALARLGPVELFAIVPADRTDFGEADEAVLARSAQVAVRSAHLSQATLSHPAFPAEIPLQDGPEVRRSLDQFASGAYDLIWFFDIRAWLLAAMPTTVPQIVDLIDLEDEKIRARLSLPADGTPATRHGWRRWPGRAWSGLEARRWTRLYLRASRSVSLTVVCSSLDASRASRSGVHPVAVVANTYPQPRLPMGRDSVGARPTVLFQGTMRYPPNADGAHWLVAEIMPLVRAQLPDVQVRLVGLASPAVQTLDQLSGVSVVGQVEDIESELARADVVVVPVRFGSGTRLEDPRGLCPPDSCRLDHTRCRGSGHP